MCINLQAHVLIAVKLLIWKVSSHIHSIMMSQSLVAFQLFFAQETMFIFFYQAPIKS